MNAEELKKRDADQKARVQQQAREAQELRERERREHQEAIAREAEQSKSALEEALEALTKPEQKLVRLHAAVLCEEPGRLDGHGGQRRAVYDAMALRLARYMALGEV
jgi:hypothetical protein